MQLFSLLISILCLIFLLSCSSSFEQLSKNTNSPNDEFSKHLLEVYKTKANFEAKEMHDWNSAKLYSEKALKAAKEIKIKPEKINYWNIPKNKIRELNIAYDNLMIVYDEAINEDPYNLAVSISSLDCWGEQQEENWQTWDINRCKNDFLRAMHNIYNSLDKKNQINNKKNKVSKKTKNESVTVVTKNKDEKILQIIYFDFDKSNLSNVSINLIKNFIKKNRNNIDKYLVIGHTDTKGTKEYNQKLSLKRAEFVKKIIISYGIKTDQIKIMGKGESSLIVQTNDDTRHPANRRAEIKPLN